MLAILLYNSGQQKYLCKRLRARSISLLHKYFYCGDNHSLKICNIFKPVLKEEQGKAKINNKERKYSFGQKKIRAYFMENRPNIQKTQSCYGKDI